jgi:hypothetical protein
MNGANRTPPDTPIDIEALVRLHPAGWSIGDFAFRDGTGGLVWLVSGSNGENLIGAEGLPGMRLGTAQSIRPGRWVCSASKGMAEQTGRRDPKQ